MINRTALFVLTGGPFQWLSAIEARAQLTAAPTRCYLLMTQSCAQCPELLGLAWHGIRVVEYRAPRGRASRWQRLRVLRRFVTACSAFADSVGPIDDLLIGHTGEVMRAVARRVRPRRVIALDDGTGAVAAYRARFNRTSARHDPRLKSVAKRLVYGASTKDLGELTAFTVFKDVDLLPRDQHVQHRFEFLRSTLSGRRVEHHLILGTPAVSYGIVSPPKYERMMERLAAELDGAVVYRTHHSEKPADCRLPTEWLVDDSHGPFELHLIRHSVPKQIIGWFSTALIGAKLLVGDSCPVLRIDVDISEVNLVWRPTVSMCIDIAHAAGVEVMLQG